MQLAFPFSEHKTRETLNRRYVCISNCSLSVKIIESRCGARQHRVFNSDYQECDFSILIMYGLSINIKHPVITRQQASSPRLKHICKRARSNSKYVEREAHRTLNSASDIW